MFSQRDVPGYCFGGGDAEGFSVVGAALGRGAGFETGLGGRCFTARLGGAAG